MTNWHQLTDEQLAIEIGSVIRERVESEAPPAGMFLSIRDRLGEQDSVNPVSRVLGWLDPGNWRLPMFTGTVIKAAALIVIAVAIVGVLVFQGRDSEQDEVAPAVEPTATPIAQVEPTATPVAQVESTSEPEGSEDAVVATTEPESPFGPGIVEVDELITNSGGLAWDGEALWTSSKDDGNMTRFSLAGQVLLKQRAAGIASGVTSDGQSVWVTDSNFGRVIEFDLEGNELSRFNFIGPAGIDFDDAGLWVHSSNNLTRFGLDGTQLFKISGVNLVAIGEGRIFSAEADQLVIYDTSGEVLSTSLIPVGERRQVHRIVYGDDSVWVITELGDLVIRYDVDGSETGRWSSRLTTTGLTVGADVLWLQSRDIAMSSSSGVANLYRVDLTTGETHLILEGIDSGDGLVTDGKYVHLSWVSGKPLIIDPDVEGIPVDDLLTEVEGELEHPDLALEWPDAGTNVKVFPEGIKRGSERLDSDEVERLWTEALADSQITMTVSNDWFDVKLCGSGRGLAFSDVAQERYVFDWVVKQSVGAAWNVATVDFLNPSGTYHWNQGTHAQIVLKADENGLVIDDGLAAFDGPVTIFDYPECPA